MTEYAIEITLPAERDLAKIYTYISETLKEPQSARRVYFSIKKEIISLSYMPRRYGIIGDDRYLSIELHRLFVENFAVFYTIDNQKMIVYILRILYVRREWRQILFEDDRAIL